MAVRYMSFEEVLAELQIDEEELKKLVSQGELRGFRDGRSMKFKRDDVLSIKEGRETEPTIILTDSDQEMGIAESSDELILEDSTSDTVINIGDIMGAPKSEAREIVFDTTEEFTVSPHDSDPQSVIPTVEVPSVSEDFGFVETESDAMLIEVGSGDFTSSSGVEFVSDDSVVEIGAVSDSGSMETEAFELMEESGETDGFVAEVAPRSGRQSRRGASASTRMRALEIQRATAHPAWTFVILLLIVFPLLGQAGVLFNDMSDVEPAWIMDITEKLRGLVDGIFVALNDK